MTKQGGFAVLAVLGGMVFALSITEAVTRVPFPNRIKSSWLEITPRGYVVNQRSVTAHHAWEGAFIRYDFSAQRTRGEEPEAIPQKKVFAFGDSFTFGLHLDESQTFIAHLNQRLRTSSDPTAWRILNAGVGGTGFADWVAYLEEEGHRLSMDAIWIVHNYNDFERMVAKHLYRMRDGDLHPSRRWRQTWIKDLLDRSALWRAVQERSVIASLLQDVMMNSVFYVEEVDPSRDIDASQEHAVVLAAALYDRLVALSQRLGVPVFVTTTGFITSDRLSTLDAAVFRALPSVLAERGIPAVDLTPLLLERGEGSLEAFQLRGDTHPNPEGAYHIADLLWHHVFAPDIFPSFRERP